MMIASEMIFDHYSRLTRDCLPELHSVPKCVILMKYAAMLE